MYPVTTGCLSPAVTVAFIVAKNCPPGILCWLATASACVKKALPFVAAQYLPVRCHDANVTCTSSRSKRFKAARGRRIWKNTDSHFASCTPANTQLLSRFALVLCATTRFIYGYLAITANCANAG